MRLAAASSELTCSQETMSRQHELRRNLHFTVGVGLEGGEVGLVFIGVHLFPVSVVSCREKERQNISVTNGEICGQVSFIIMSPKS